MRKNVRISLYTISQLWIIASIPTANFAAESTNIARRFLEFSGKPVSGLMEDSAITFDYALQLTASQNPNLVASKAGLRASEGRLHQIGARPNPELSIEVANFGRSSGSGPEETTIGLQQPLELFGKRGARKEFASYGLEAQKLELDKICNELFRKTSNSFYSVIAGQQLLENAESQLDLSVKVHDAVKLKVTDGAVPRAELLRAESAVRLAEINMAEAKADLNRRRISLTSLWGTTDTTIEVTGELDWWLNVELPLDYINKLDSNKEVQSQKALLRASEAAVKVAKSTRKPDLAVGAGYRRLHDENQNSFLAWLSLPLPLFNRNQGGISEAVATISQNEAILESTRIRVTGEFKKLLLTIENQRSQVMTLLQKVLPPAEQALAEIDQAYRQGSQSYINVLDAQRTLAEIKILKIESMTRGAEATSELESILGYRLK